MKAAGSFETSRTTEPMTVTCQQDLTLQWRWNLGGLRFSQLCPWGFWNMMLCNWVINSRRFERTFFLGLLDNKNPDVTIFRNVRNHSRNSTVSHTKTLASPNSNLTIHIHSWHERKLIWYIEQIYLYCCYMMRRHLSHLQEAIKAIKIRYITQIILIISE
jgi:hypothetical protein